LSAIKSRNAIAQAEMGDVEQGPMAMPALQFKKPIQ
jgi:hypothetical protein